jgi:hypothetical protein
MPPRPAGGPAREHAAAPRLTQGLAVAEDDVAPPQREERPAGHLPALVDGVIDVGKQAMAVARWVATTSDTTGRPAAKYRGDE